MTRSPGPVGADPLAIRRVAFVCDYSLDYLGGAQTALLEQAKALRSAGVDVTVIAPRRLVGRDGVAAEEVRIPARITLPVVRLPVLRNTARLRRRLRTLLTERAVEVVHLHSEFGIAAAAIEVARELDITVVHTVHTFFWQTEAPVQGLLRVAVPRLHRWLTGLPSPGKLLAERPGDSALRNMTLAVAQSADRVISPSAHQAARLRAAGLEAVDVVSNTLADIPAAAALHTVDPPLRLIWIGRCVEEKRILPFVRSAAAALQRLEPGRLSITVVGEGDQLTAARALAAGEPGIRFLGRLPHSAIQQLLAEAHSSVLTSFGFDNQPMTVVESIMALRGVIYCDPALTEGLRGAGVPALGSGEELLTDALVAAADDPGAVVAASQAAVAVRQEFEPATFSRRALASYGRARSGLS
jgi:glycosyltransferase involved in cell wall biosynthesis